MKKLAIITGASKGIGKATAQKFSDSDWQVINLSRTPCDIESIINVTTELASNDLKINLENSLSKFLINKEQICLIHNACAYYSGSVGEENFEELEISWKVNILAPAIINNILIPYMKKNSSILYIGSTLSEKAVSNCMPYVVSKHAVLGLMRSTCQDLSGRGIHTCCICPGFTETEMLMTHLNEGQRQVNDITNMITMKRLIQPEEIANFVFYTANQPIINGSVLHSNLGLINI